MLEVEDTTDQWDPPGSDGSCRPQLLEREREEHDRDSKDISRTHADCASMCQSDLTCHVGKSGKNVRRAT